MLDFQEIKPLDKPLRELTSTERLRLSGGYLLQKEYMRRNYIKHRDARVLYNKKYYREHKKIKNEVT